MPATPNPKVEDKSRIRRVLWVTSRGDLEEMLRIMTLKVIPLKAGGTKARPYRPEGFDNTTFIVTPDAFFWSE